MSAHRLCIDEGRRSHILTLMHWRKESGMP